MSGATTQLSEALKTLTRHARESGLSDSGWARRAGLRKETLSRLRRRQNCDFATLQALALAAGAQMTVAESPSATLTADGHFPAHMDRDYEERLLSLCASRDLDPERWAGCGPRFFMAGLAVLVASVEGFDRSRLLALGERLHPGISEPVVANQWLKRSPVRPSRFLPMLAATKVPHAA